MITGIVTLAEDDGSEGCRVLDGPAVSKLTHSIDALWDPITISHEIDEWTQVKRGGRTKVQGPTISFIPGQRVDISRGIVTRVNDVQWL